MGVWALVETPKTQNAQLIWGHNIWLLLQIMHKTMKGKAQVICDEFNWLILYNISLPQYCCIMLYRQMKMLLFLFFLIFCDSTSWLQWSNWCCAVWAYTVWFTLIHIMTWRDLLNVEANNGYTKRAAKGYSELQAHLAPLFAATMQNLFQLGWHRNFLVVLKALKAPGIQPTPNTMSHLKESAP